MDLSRAFERFPNFRVARPSDEDQLHAMIEETPMRVGGMDLVYDRRPRFDAQLDYQAPNHLTIVADVDGEIRGFGSYAWGSRLAGGRPTTAMYIGNFRVKLDRRVAAGWRACYPGLLRAFNSDPAFGPSEWIYTGILRENAAARRSLAESRKGFFYHPLASLEMVNTFFRPPFRGPRRRRAGLRIEKGSAVGETKLREFLVAANRALFLGYDFSGAEGNEWDRRRKAWPGFAAEDFLVARDAADEIVACTLPWSPGAAMRMRVNRLAAGAALAFGLLRRIGFRVPELGKPFSTLYLTHLAFAPGASRETRAAAIAGFLDAVFRSPLARGYHMVSYPDADGLRRLPPLRNPATQITGVELYLVTTAETPPAIPPHEGVAFEMALV